MIYITQEDLKNNILAILGPENKVEVFEYAKSHKPCVFINGLMLDKWTLRKETNIDTDVIRIVRTNKNNIQRWKDLILK